MGSFEVREYSWLTDRRQWAALSRKTQQQMFPRWRLDIPQHLDIPLKVPSTMEIQPLRTHCYIPKKYHMAESRQTSLNHVLGHQDRIVLLLLQRMDDNRYVLSDDHCYTISIAASAHEARYILLMACDGVKGLVLGRPATKLSPMD